MLTIIKLELKDLCSNSQNNKGLFYLKYYHSMINHTLALMADLFNSIGCYSVDPKLKSDFIKSLEIVWIHYSKQFIK